MLTSRGSFKLNGIKSVSGEPVKTSAVRIISYEVYYIASFDVIPSISKLIGGFFHDIKRYFLRFNL